MRRRICATSKLSAGVLLMLSLAMGCERIGRARQCSALVDQVNTRLDTVSELADGGKLDAQRYRSISDEYAQLGKELSKPDLGDPKLDKAVKDLGKVFEEAASITRQHADALARDDTRAQGLARARLPSLERRQKSLAGRVDALCHRP